MSNGRGGCLPLILGLILLTIIFDDDGGWQGTEVQSETYDPRGARRPMPENGGDIYEIAEPGAPIDSQGTAFAIDRDGVWLTAQHVAVGCRYIGLEQGRSLDPVGSSLLSQESDATLLLDAPASPTILALANPASLPYGAPGIHMGFPSGRPGIVFSQFLGRSSASRGPQRQAEPVFAWAETDRALISGDPLGGISGGPTFDGQGRVIGVNSASTERRGRVLTTAPDAIARLVTASGRVDERGTPLPMPTKAAALATFRQLRDDGTIRIVYCDVP